MDIFFQDPSAVPLPPDEVKIVELRAESWPDKKRVKVTLEITPFLKRPNGEISLIDAKGNEVSIVNIIESIETKMEITLHLRGVDPEGDFLVSASIYYTEEPISNGEEVEVDMIKQKRLVVDRAETRLHF
jgi:hypothetical protein